MVSWNEAAEMKDGVCSDALVIPSSTGSPKAGLLAFGKQRVVDVLELDAVDVVATI